jgi:hypothetical protein
VGLNLSSNTVQLYLSDKVDLKSNVTWNDDPITQILPRPDLKNEVTTSTSQLRATLTKLTFH